MPTLTRFAFAQLARIAGWPSTSGQFIARFRQTRRVERLLGIPARLIMVLVAFGLAFSPGHVLASHCPERLAAAELTRHADLGAEEVSGHHVYEDGDSDEQGPGHLHGHDPADHSHQLAFTVLVGVQPHGCFSQSWMMHIQAGLRLGPDFGLERPPKRELSI